MIQAYTILFSALMISTMAGYFSIVGLVNIFYSAPVSIAIMGASLELAKLSTASWLYTNWKTIPVALKTYLTAAVVILSFITSMGIFGYLSKAHIEHQSVAGTNNVELKVLDQQEKIVQSKIDFLIKQSEKQEAPSKRIENDLTKAQTELKSIVEKKRPLLQDKNQLEAEIGPLKYITEFIYDNSDDTTIGKAVRWVIITLIFVFDPLAILLLIAFNLTYKREHPARMFNFPEDELKTIDEHLNDSNKKDDKSYEIPPEIMRKVFKTPKKPKSN